MQSENPVQIPHRVTHAAISSAAVSHRPYKQQRLLNVYEANDAPRINHIARLPPEMLHEVLSWTAPPDILALSRTSRYFCATLISDRKVWRDARRRFRPQAIPDPTSNWTESAYIAFIFDGKPCEVCKRVTYRTPVSYSLRAHVCFDAACVSQWLSGLKYIQAPENDDVDLPHIVAVQSWLPYADVQSHLHTGAKGYRPMEWEAAIQRHRESLGSPQSRALVQQEFARKATRLSRIMKSAKQLSVWGQRFEQWRKDVNVDNMKFLKDKAIEEKWDIDDFVNTALYQNLRRHHNKTFEKIRDKDFQLVKQQFCKEVGDRGETRIRRIIENTARLNREDLRMYWDKLKKTVKGPLPPYAEFRRLNIVKTLERKNTTEDAALAGSAGLQTVGHELKMNRDTRKHIRQEIDNWLRDTRKKLAIKLGDPYSFFATVTGCIRTVDRTTAWFWCTRCNRVDRRHMENHALTFANVCTHECQGITKKARLATQWDVNVFEPDTKAIAAAKEVLRVCALDEQHATWEALNSFGCRFLCKSCPNTIVMDASSVIGHSKRHDTLTLELLPQDQIDAIWGAPLERGLVSKVMGSSEGGKIMRYKTSYACRHCRNRKPFTFDGLRSHMKSKHHIEHMRDEDLLKLEQAPVQEVD